MNPNLPDPARSDAAPDSSLFESLLPVTYSSGFVVSLVYLVRTEDAAACLANCNLRPLVLPGRRSVVVLTLFDFQSTSIGPYREVSLGIISSRSGRGMSTPLDFLRGPSAVGAWIVALPVTSDLACQGGIALFGYPKSKCRMDVRHGPKTCSFNVRDSVQNLVSADVLLGFGPRLPVRRLTTYSELDGKLLQTNIPVRWSPRLCGGRGSCVHVANVESALARDLRRLNLPANPAFVLHGSGFEGSLTRPSTM